MNGRDTGRDASKDLAHVQRWRCRAYSEGASDSKGVLSDFDGLERHMTWNRTRNGPVSGQYLKMLRRVVDMKRDGREPKITKFMTTSQILQNSSKFGFIIQREYTQGPEMLNGFRWTNMRSAASHRFYCWIRRALPKSDLVCTIFHSDIYRPFEQNEDAKSLTPHMRKVAVKACRLENITATFIDALLHAHFDRGISLSKDSLAGAWMSACFSMHVRTSSSSWEAGLFVVLGNEDYFQPRDTPRVREAIASAWGIRPMSAVTDHLTAHHMPAKSSTQAYEQAREDNEGSSRAGLVTSLVESEHRGRKRRHTRWILKEFSDGQSTEPRPEIMHEQIGQRTTDSNRRVSSEVASVIPLPVRGRLRRRRRRVGDDHIQYLVGGSGINHPPGTATTEHVPRIPRNGADLSGLEYETRSDITELPQANVSIRAVSVKQYTTLQLTRETDEDIVTQSGRSGPDEIEVPALRFSLEDSPDGQFNPSLKQSQTYFLMMSQKYASVPMESELDMVTGVIVDGAGYLSTLPAQNSEKEEIKLGNSVPGLCLYRSILQAEPNAFRGAVSSSQRASIPSETIKTQPLDYWYKFARLVCTSRQKQRAPYSNAYGLAKTSQAILVQVRKDIWGILDVDNVTISSPYPRSRATWTQFFEDDDESPMCKCKMVSVPHRVYRCDNDIRETAICYEYRSRNTRFDDLLDNTLEASYRPYEYISELDLLKQPPEVAQDGLSGKLEKELSKSNPKEDALQTYYLNYGLYHMQGLGVPKSNTEGLKWIREAAAIGSERATTLLTRLSTTVPLKSATTPLGARAPDVAPLSSKPVHLPQFHQGAISYSSPCQDESTFQGEAIVDLLSGMGQIRYPFERGNLFLANHHILRTQLEKTRLWSSEEDFWTFPKASEQAINTLSEVQKADRGLYINGNDLFLVNLINNVYGQYEVLGSLLHFAALFGLLDTVRLLISQGYSVDAQSSVPSLATPIQCAAVGEHPYVVEAFVDAGAQVNPPMLSGKLRGSIPSVFHLLADWSNETAAINTARKLHEAGGDVNLKCQHFENGFASLTPLRYAMIRGKVNLVKVLIELGARFATKPVGEPVKQHICFLEARITDVPILEVYFDYINLHDYKLPTKFYETPLGLLLDEDDGPHRSIRRGFNDKSLVIRALDTLLEIQPGYEEEALAAMVRHDHMSLVDHVLAHKKWSVEWRWKGLTMLHLAVLYGRPQMCSVLLTKYSADATAVTSKRQLTCLHLLALLPRHPETDYQILSLLKDVGILIDAKEVVDGLTAFQIAARNQKAHLLVPLLRAGANPLLPVYDRLGILAEGRYGSLKDITNRPRAFLDNIHITGEVVWQFHQDSAYSLEFVITLLEAVLGTAQDDSVFYLDSKRTVSLLHVIATIPNKITFHKLFQTVTTYLPQNFDIDGTDGDGDTALHYAAAARKYHNIHSLISRGASATRRNFFGITSHELMIWSTIYLGGRFIKFHRPDDTTWERQRDRTLTAGDPPRHKLRKSERIRGELRAVIRLFKKHGCRLHPGLEKFIVAWDHVSNAKGHSYKYNRIYSEMRLFLVPVEATSVQVITTDEGRGVTDANDGSEKGTETRHPDDVADEGGRVDRLLREVTVSTSSENLDWNSEEEDKGEDFETDDESADEAKDNNGDEAGQDGKSVSPDWTSSADNDDDYDSVNPRKLPKWKWDHDVKLTQEQRTLLESFFGVKTPLVEKMKKDRSNSL